MIMSDDVELHFYASFYWNQLLSSPAWAKYRPLEFLIIKHLSVASMVMFKISLSFELQFLSSN